jgi:hypothetical protein
MTEEREFRRSVRLTRTLGLKLCKPIRTEYIIYSDNNLRFNVSTNTLQEKTLRTVELVVFGNQETASHLEPCFISDEKDEFALFSNSFCEHLLQKGVLCVKKIFVKEKNVVLYSLQYIDRKIIDYDKLVLELELPIQEDGSDVELFKELAFKYQLLPVTLTTPPPYQKVEQDIVAVENIYIKLPKLDGTRGRIQFFEDYTLFNGDSTSIVLSQSLLEQTFDHKMRFFLQSTPLIGEFMPGGRFLVVIDLACNTVPAPDRFKVLLNIAKSRLRIITRWPPEEGCTATILLFQHFDRDLIEELNLPLDGNIIILKDGRILKAKQENQQTYDLQYLGNGLLADSEGIVYKKLKGNDKKAEDELKLNAIYECKRRIQSGNSTFVHNSTHKPGDGACGGISDSYVFEIVKERPDKFVANFSEIIKNDY